MVGLAIDSRSTWLPQTAQTDDGAYHRVLCGTRARQNAHYTVTFTGDGYAGRSELLTWLSVFRMFNGKMTDGPGAATLAGLC